MQVSVVVTKGLEREMSVKVPRASVDDALQARFKQIARTAKLPGFRPGKAPIHIVKQHYAAEATEKVVADIVETTLRDALLQEKLSPIAYPKVSITNLNEDQLLVYNAVFEVYPEIVLEDISALEVERVEAEINEADIDEMVEVLREQRASWVSCQRAAKQGDQLTIDFHGTIDGEPFSGGEGENVDLVLGSGMMIPGFEDQLLGVQVGDQKTIEVVFPEKYQNQDLQGKQACFAVQVREVKERELPSIDDAFMQSLGIENGDVDQLRARVKEHMQRELDNALKISAKREAMDALLRHNKIECPRVLVDAEIAALKQKALQRYRYSGKTKIEALPDEPFIGEAQRRVQLGLILAELAKQRNIVADKEKVRETIESLAASYQEPETVVNYYYGNSERLAEIESVVVEEKIVAEIFQAAVVKVSKKAFKEVVNRAA